MPRRSQGQVPGWRLRHAKEQGLSVPRAAIFWICLLRLCDNPGHWGANGRQRDRAGSALPVAPAAAIGRPVLGLRRQRFAAIWGWIARLRLACASG